MTTLQTREEPRPWKLPVAGCQRLTCPWTRETQQPLISTVVVVVVEVVVVEVVEVPGALDLVD
jgi:hypothetical protein